MSTHHQRSEGKERYWRTIMRRWRVSGRSVRAFCREQGISEPSFYGWRRTLAVRDAGAQVAVGDAGTPEVGEVAAVRFVPMHVAPDPVAPKASEMTASNASTNAAGALELIVGGGRRLRIGPGFDGPTLRRLLALLEEGRP